MVAQKPSKRDKLERLTRQLEELKALREQLAKERSPASSTENHQQVPSPAQVPVDSPNTKSPQSSMPAGDSAETNAISFGKNSQKSRFLSITSVGAEEWYPRILLVAGALPDLSTKDFLNTPPMLYNKAPLQGNLFLSRMPDGFEGNMVALPTFEFLAKCGDPVALLAPSELISESKLPIAPGDDVVLVVDRAVVEPFDSHAFYVWDVKGKVSVGWLPEEPPVEEASRIGKIIYGVVDVDQELREKKSCWEEENETYQ